MSVAADGATRSLIPARIDRLPWSPFHTRMVAALGVAWILDGLEISIASAVGDTLKVLSPSSWRAVTTSNSTCTRIGWFSGTVAGASDRGMRRRWTTARAGGSAWYRRW